MGERIQFVSRSKEDMADRLRLAKGVDLSIGIDRAVLDEVKKTM